MFKIKVYVGAIFVMALLVPSFVARITLAQMNSTSYKVQSDSVNFAGNLSNSTNYRIEDTAGEIATGLSGSTNYNIAAGYQQMHNVYISIATVSDVVMSPSIGGVTGGTSNGSTVVTVTTDSPSGYDLFIKASSSPALIFGANSFADYTPSGVNPDFTFSILSSDSEFAFSPEGTHIVQKYKDDGASNCNTGSTDTVNACWDALSTTNKTISTSTSPNQPSGTATTLKFRAQSGSLHLQPAGEYTATTTVTAIPL